MTYSIKIYWSTTLVLPSIIIIIMLVLFLGSGYGYWIKLSSHQRTVPETLKYLFCLFIVIFCTVSQCKYLVNGGLKLLTETEDQLLTHIGVIQTITEPSERFPGFKASHSYGADIVIDNQVYFVPTSGAFKEGDCVEVGYLPNSHYILSIYSATTDDTH